MILPSMSFKEMYDDLVKDLYKIQIRIDKNRPKAIKHFKKSKSFPDWYIDPYKIPATNNQYIFFFYAGTLKDSESPHCQYFCIVFNGKQRLIVRGSRMGYRHTPNCELIMLPQIHAYTSHFFHRYNERYLHKDLLTPNEIAGLFFVRNYYSPTPIKLNKNINKNLKEYGKHNDLGMRVQNGFCFTQTALEVKESEDGRPEHDRVDAMMIIYTTFMNESDMSHQQITAIQKEHNEVWSHCLEELRETHKENQIYKGDIRCVIFNKQEY